MEQLQELTLPELLIPAGSLEKLKVAFLYGADAVYLGGPQYGLRASADNFTRDEMGEGVRFAKKFSGRVYVVLNGFLHDKDFIGLKDFLHDLEEMGVDAVICSDLGVISFVQKYSSLPIHLSTQASCLNSQGAHFWKEMGVKRLILGREASLMEAKAIQEHSNLEVECFGHGSMCMAYSGHCTISNYTSGRDSNRGGCAHSCRFEYSLESKDKAEEVALKSLKKDHTYFMSSKDLLAVSLIPDFVENKITSLKVEGRMKSAFYVGKVAKVYRDALDTFKDVGHFSQEKIQLWEKELSLLPTRGSFSGNLVDLANEDSIYDEDTKEKKESSGFLGVVKDKTSDDMIILVKNSFQENDVIELSPLKGPSVGLDTHNICNILGEKVSKTKPNTLVRLPRPSGHSIAVGSLIHRGVFL